MTCPHCSKRISDKIVLSAAARITRARIQNPGRKPVMRKCPRCGRQHSAREMRRYKGAKWEELDERG